jgi:hypothetical protein
MCRRGRGVTVVEWMGRKERHARDRGCPRACYEEREREREREEIGRGMRPGRREEVEHIKRLFLFVAAAGDKRNGLVAVFPVGGLAVGRLGAPAGRQEDKTLDR